MTEKEIKETHKTRFLSSYKLFVKIIFALPLKGTKTSTRNKKKRHCYLKFLRTMMDFFVRMGRKNLNLIFIIIIAISFRVFQSFQKNAF